MELLIIFNIILKRGSRNASFFFVHERTSSVNELDGELFFVLLFPYRFARPFPSLQAERRLAAGKTG